MRKSLNFREWALRQALQARPEDSRLLENLALYRSKWPA
jgi:hypothetical protein